MMQPPRDSIFDRPLRGREFFEEIIHNDLDPWPPYQVQSLLCRAPDGSLPVE
jgi:hypothetical protein